MWREKRCGPGGVRALDGGDASGMCTGRARLKAGAPRARAERTPNMKRMFVTLEVSKLSGWLNADAEENMLFMFVTLDVSKLSAWLNADAP